MAPRIVMPREFREASEYSPPFYSRAGKIVVGITTEVTGSDVTLGLQMWLEAAQDWRTSWTAALPIDTAGPVTRYTFHNHVFGITTYSVTDFFVKAYIPRNAAMRLFMEHDTAVPVMYSVMVEDCVSAIEAVA